jgi:hypothetical protein
MSIRDMQDRFYPDTDRWSDIVKKRNEDRPTGSLSVILVVLIAQVGPQVFVTAGIQYIFIMRPQVTEGIVIRVLPVPPLIITAPRGMPVQDNAAAVPRRGFFTSYHPFSHPGTILLKLKIQSCFGK